VTVTDCVVSFFALVSLRASSPVWASEASLARTRERGDEENGDGGSTVLVKQTELRGVNALPVL